MAVNEVDQREKPQTEHEVAQGLWEKYRRYHFRDDNLDFSLDISRVDFDQDYLSRMGDKIAAAMTAMQRLESGQAHNIDEDRKVGHYWLRNPSLAPTADIRAAIINTQQAIDSFADNVKQGVITGRNGRFEHIIHIGIGGSALGPQLIYDALVADDNRFSVQFLDNADIDGIERALRRLEGRLGKTLVVMVSKSGWTPTPDHILQEITAQYQRVGLDFAKHAVAITVAESQLALLADQQGWLQRFELWDWVGGRTSITSAVGLLLAALCDVDTTQLLQGAAAMDELTRSTDPQKNPAMLLALMWYWLSQIKNKRNMVVLPYRDRSSGLPRYIQQLVMESVGKKLDRSNAVVHQGLTVYGHKGSSDQHSYVQQLRDGRDDFFANLIHFQQSSSRQAVALNNGRNLEDYLYGYFEETRNALYDRGRNCISLQCGALSPLSVGAIVALFERAVGFYAELIDVNAYHQPGVDKDAAHESVQLQTEILKYLQRQEEKQTALQVCVGIGKPQRIESVYKQLMRLSASPSSDINFDADSKPFEEAFFFDHSIVISTKLQEDVVATIRSRHPEKSFGYFISDTPGGNPKDFILFEGNNRNTSEWKNSFESQGQYFVNNSDAGFVATAEAMWQFKKRIKKDGMFEVGVFHSHLRHPANFSGIDYNMHMNSIGSRLWHAIISMRNPSQPQFRAFGVSSAGVRERQVVEKKRPLASTVHRVDRTKANIVEQAKERLRLRKADKIELHNAKAILQTIDAIEKTQDEALIDSLLTRGLFGRSEANFAEFIEQQMVRIPATKFTMGSDALQSKLFCGEAAEHTVELSSYNISSVAVTQHIFAQFDSSFKATESNSGAPKVDLDWYQAKLFALWVGCRLPTEAEWEYACGAGGNRQWCCDSELQLTQYAWFSENSEGQVHPVGLKQPNQIGLYDMHGNIWEWCEDDYAAAFYSRSGLRNPVNTQGGLGNERRSQNPIKVTRGGGSTALAEMCRTRHRMYEPADFVASDLGFRLVR